LIGELQRRKEARPVAELMGDGVMIQGMASLPAAGFEVFYGLKTFSDGAVATMPTTEASGDDVSMMGQCTCSPQPGDNNPVRKRSS
jgi:hypothetical protein